MAHGTGDEALMWTDTDSTHEGLSALAAREAVAHPAPRQSVAELAVARERAAIVAWLRTVECAGLASPCPACFARLAAADDIERGEYRHGREG